MISSRCARGFQFQKLPWSSLLFRGPSSLSSSSSDLLLSKNRVLLPLCAAMMASTRSGKALTVETLNPHVKQAEYAVRGELSIRSDQLRTELLANPTAAAAKYAFREVVHCNIGNPQDLGQQPITFFRQVAALVELPHLVLDIHQADKLKALFPQDAIDRARAFLNEVGSVGSYSHSQGVPSVRQHVAAFIEERDGYPANPNHIFLTNGASEGVKAVLNALIGHSKVGVMTPIPQYPLYSASLTLLNGRLVPYYLNEEEDWGMSVKDLEEARGKATKEGIDVRAMVVINPGNPTGQCLSEQNMQEIIRFCVDHNILLMADEVYQANAYQRPFHSFKKVLFNMIGKDSSFKNAQLVSLHSISKGMVGECGRRGGYFEVVGMDEGVVAQFYKLASIGLCPAVQGQLMVDLMVRPPKPGDESYDLYHKEMIDIYESLKRRSVKLVSAFNKLKGVHCNAAQGAMYVFPQVQLPKRAIQAAKEAGKEPDVFYALKLLDATGVCIVPGSGFGQKPGTFHFRSTFLPQESKFDEFIAHFVTFHEKFMEQYRDA